MATLKCPRCGMSIDGAAGRCGECGYRFETGPEPAVKPVKQPAGKSDVFSPAKEKLINVTVKIIVVAIIGAVVYFGFAGIKIFIESLEPQHPHPMNPVETATIFFTSLSTQDYQRCYQLMEAMLRNVTVIEGDNRYRYFRHFERIGNYLIKRCGQDFITGMQVDPSGNPIRFTGGVEMSIRYNITQDGRKRSHYGIEMIEGFPIDKAPALGLEQHNRDIDAAIDENSGIADIGPVDKPEEVIPKRPNESPGPRQMRLIKSFDQTRMLDTRHIILDYIIKESANAPEATHALLARIARDQTLAPQLRNDAQKALPPTGQ